MKPAREQFIKLLIGVVMLMVVTTATYLIGVIVTSLSGGSIQLGALAAAAFFFVGWVLAMSWIKRQFDEWWDQ